MRIIFHDPILAMWFLFALCFFAMGFYATAVWWEVRGLRGLAMATLSICLGLLTTLLAWLRVGDSAILSTDMITIGIRTVFPAMAISVFVLVDAWSAEHNDHRSIVTRMYQFFKRLGTERSKRRATELSEIEGR